MSRSSQSDNNETQQNTDTQPHLNFTPEDATAATISAAEVIDAPTFQSAADIIPIFPEPVYRSISTSQAYQQTAFGNLDVYRSVQSSGSEVDVDNSYDGFSNIDAQSNGTHTYGAKELQLNPKHADPAPAFESHVVEPTTTNNSTPSEPPLAPGGYLEPNTHFYVDDNVDFIIPTLIAILRAANVDCKYDDRRFKIKCEAYHACARVEFFIRIFTALNSQRYVVECQRRFGDCIVLNQLYQIIRDAYNGSNTPGGSVPPSIKPSMICPSLPDMPELQVTVESQLDGLKCLVAMGRSECVDVRCGAISALADMSSEPSMREAMVSIGCVPLFLDCIPCSYADIHRCAVTGLANLIINADRSMIEALFTDEAIKHSLCQLIHSQCPMVVRETSRVLSVIAQLWTDDVKKDSDFKKCVQSLTGHDDEIARTYAQQTTKCCWKQQ